MEYTIFPIQLHLIRVSCVQIALSDILRLCVHFSDYSFGNGVRKRRIRTPHELFLNFTTSFTTSLFMYLYVILCNRMLHEKRKKALLYKDFPYIATLFRLSVGYRKDGFAFLIDSFEPSNLFVLQFSQRS